MPNPHLSLPSDVVALLIIHSSGQLGRLASCLPHLPQAIPCPPPEATLRCAPLLPLPYLTPNPHWEGKGKEQWVRGTAVAFSATQNVETIMLERYLCKSIHRAFTKFNLLEPTFSI